VVQLDLVLCSRLRFSIFTIRDVLGKSFRSFRVALLPRDPLSGTEALSRSFGRTIRVWWAFCWRTVVYSLIVRFAGSVALGFTIGILSSMSRAAAAWVPLIAQVVIDGAVGLFVNLFGDLGRGVRGLPGGFASARACPRGRSGRRGRFSGALISYPTLIRQTGFASPPGKAVSRT
jgi:hypothetical protein